MVHSNTPLWLAEETSGCFFMGRSRMSSPYHMPQAAKMTADSSILSPNADGPKSELKNFFRWKNDGYARKTVENIIVHGLKCKQKILIFLPSVLL